MNWFDKFIENSSRKVAQHSSRRSFFKKLGTTLVVGSTIPLLPVARGESGQAKYPNEVGDPNSCDYWRYCAVDGFLCGCCGGSANSCPPGTEMSPVAWIGTCKNPADGKNYLLSYNDCCGKPSCGNCLCTRNDDDTPMYRQDKANDLNWCMGASSIIYNCTTAIIIGTAIDK